MKKFDKALILITLSITTLLNNILGFALVSMVESTPIESVFRVSLVVSVISVILLLIRQRNSK